MNRNDYLELVNRLENKAFRLDLEGWLKTELFTWNWWILVTFLILPWVLWALFADKNKLLETTLFGTLVIIPTTNLDAIGKDLDFWRYPVHLLPLATRSSCF